MFQAWCFNPRPRAEQRQEALDNPHELSEVSLHFPAEISEYVACAVRNEKRPETGRFLLRTLNERRLAPDKRPAYFETAGQSSL
jgi:hypothetical protein